MGNSTRLECKYDLQGEKLYTVKWYKDGNEFYRFLPGESPEIQVFDVTGVHVDVSTLILDSFVFYAIVFFFFIIWIHFFSLGKYCNERFMHSGTNSHRISKKYEYLYTHIKE